MTGRYSNQLNYHTVEKILSCDFKIWRRPLPTSVSRKADRFAFAMQSYGSFRSPPNFLLKKTIKNFAGSTVLGYFPEYMAVGCNVAAMLIATVASMATAISIHVVSFRCSQHIHAHTAVAAVYAGKAHISGRKGLFVAEASVSTGPAMPDRATNRHNSVSHHGRGCRGVSFISCAFWIVFLLRGMRPPWLRCHGPARIAA